MANGINLGVAYISIVPDTGSFKKQFEESVDASASKAGENITKQFSRHGKTAGQGFGKSFSAELSSSMPGISAIKQTLSGYEGAAAKSGALAGKALAAAFTAAAGAAIGAAGYTLFKGFQRYQALDSAKKRLDNLNRTMVQLNKTAIDVQGTMDIVNKVVEGTPYSLSDAFTQATNAIASNVTDIERYMTVLSDAAAYAQSDIGSIGDAFTQVLNRGKLDAGIMSEQLRGLPLITWLNEVYGSQVDVTKAVTEGRIGIEQLMYVVEKFASGTAKTAGDTIAGSIENMQTAVARLGANFLSAIFGKPTDDANGLKEAIDAITERLNDVNKWVTDNSSEIKDFFDGAVSAAKDFATAINDLVQVMGGWRDAVKNMITVWAAFKALKLVTHLGEIAGKTKEATDAAKAAKDGIGGLGSAADAAATGGLAALAAKLQLISTIALPTWLGNKAANAISGEDRPWWWPIKQGVTAPFRILDEIIPDAQIPDTGPSQGNAANDILGGILGPGGGNAGGGILGLPSPTSPAQPDKPLGPPPPLQDASGDGKGEKDKRPPRPVVPFDQTLPGWVAGTPMTPSFFNAESSWLNARNDLAQARAELDQLEKSNWATAEEIQAARNRVLEQERDMHYQDMQLQEARVRAYEEFYKTGEKQADQFSNLSESLGSVVQLDEDFGISRGLVGIADNLLRFLAGLAAAPIKGLLAGAQAGMASQLPAGFPGSTAQAASATPNGLMGMYQGMFADVFGTPSAGLSGNPANANVNAMMALAQTSSGNTAYAPASDLIGGLADCSGAISDLYEVLTTGKSNPGRMFTTTNFATDAQAAQLGFRPGFRPGALNIGVNPLPGMSGHMAATLPNGVNFESGGGTGGGAMYGQGAAGALDPQFPKQYYFPLGGWQAGGGIPGRGSGDRVPVLAEPGEHMLNRRDVAAMGGQAGVYAFRNALHRETGGSILWPQDLPSTDPNAPTAPTTPQTGATPAPFGQPTQIKPPEIGPAETPHMGAGAPPGPQQPGMIGQQVSPYDQPLTGPDGKPIMGLDGQPLTGNRLAGFIPQAAKANTVAGTSNLSNIWMMGADVVNGIIDQASSAASTAVAAGIAGGTMGAGAPAAPAGAAAASFAIGLGTEAAKRGVSYGAQLGGIFSDALVEQLFPFGAPSAIGFDSANNTINGLIDSKKKAGVFDQGGMLPPGGIGVNLSPRPEPVLTQDQWDVMAQTGAGSGYGINIENVSVRDVDELSRTLSRQQRLAAMQYTGRPGM